MRRTVLTNTKVIPYTRKSPNVLHARRQYVLRMVNKSNFPAATVDKIANKLYLHPQTIWKDLKLAKIEAK